MGAASATPAGACLMPQVEAVPNAEAMDWSDYWMDAAAATEEENGWRLIKLSSRLLCAAARV